VAAVVVSLAAVVSVGSVADPDPSSSSLSPQPAAISNAARMTAAARADRRRVHVDPFNIVPPLSLEVETPATAADYMNALSSSVRDRLSPGPAILSRRSCRRH
jgi:hypothetical protein